MAPQCCRDSVAMWLLNHEPIDNMRVECRWNKGCDDGYGLYRDGIWTFHDGYARQQRLEQLTTPEATAERTAFLMDVRGKRLARAMKE